MLQPQASTDVTYPSDPLRRLLLGLGLLALALVWLGPLPQLAGHSFRTHMAMHVTVVAVAAPLLALALAGTAWDPARARPRWFAPVPASILELVVVWGWHVPAMHALARDTQWALLLEQGMFLGVGLWLWLSALGGAASRRRERAAAGIGGLLMTSMHMALLGALLALAPRALYSHHGAAALADQHWGGVLMLIGGGTAYLAGGLYLLWLLLRQPSQEEPQC